MSAGTASFGYDANGNLTGDGASSYVYDIENRLVSASGATSASLRYDPLGRLFETSGGSAGITRLLYDGDELVGEYDAAGTTLRRYAHGPGSDDPLAWYEGTGMTSANRRHLLTDHQGSITAISDPSGAPFAINRYDEWGVPDTSNSGRFQYTGQAWIPELGMYYYKARIYSPTLGRFLQTDPIGYNDGPHLYAYVGNDPVNKTDPTGTSCVQNKESGKYDCKVDDITSFRRAGYTRVEIRRVETAMTREVNRLAKNPTAERTISVQGKSMTVTAGQIANAVAAAHVRFQRHDSAFASATGGPLVGAGRHGPLARDIAEAETKKQLASVSARYIINIHHSGMAAGHNLGGTIIHEGIHFLPQNSVFRDLTAFHSRHGTQFNAAAEYFQGLPE